MMVGNRKVQSYFYDKRSWMFLICAIGVYSLIYTRYTISIAMFLLAMLSLFSKVDGNWKWNWNFRGLSSSAMGQAVIALSLFFWVPLITGLWSEHTADFWVRMRVKLPFLFLPFTFYFLPRFRKKEYIGIFYVLILTSLISAADVLIQYVQDFEYYNRLVQRGGSLPTPVNHVRYSLLIGLASISCFVLAYKRQFIFNRREFIWLLIAGLLLFAYLHILAVRTGLVTAYISLFILSSIILYRERNWLLAIGLITVLVALPFIAYRTLPSFFQKINYVITDYKALQKGEGFLYSDATRLRSLKIGKDIFLEHPYIGIGVGDLKKEAVSRFRKNYPENNKYVAPHNQWVTFLAGTGLLGFVVLLGAFIHPLLDDRWKRDLLFFIFQLMIALSFMVENTLENSVGVGTYLFFTLFGLSYLHQEGDLK